MSASLFDYSVNIILQHDTIVIFLFYFFKLVEAFHATLEEVVEADLLVV
jgi:hypothetical protein